MLSFYRAICIGQAVIAGILLAAEQEVSVDG